MNFPAIHKVMMFSSSASSFVGAAFTLVAPPHVLTWIGFILCVASGCYCLYMAIITEV